MIPRRMIGVVLAALLVASVLASTVRADEIAAVTYPDLNYEPGPGWPAGWTPPSVPTTITPAMRTWVENSMKQVPELTRLEMRVLSPLPAWTTEYPYYWTEDIAECGSTVYVYWYPTPDQGLILKSTGISYSPSKRKSAPCQMEPVYAITKEVRPTKEEQDATDRFFAFDAELSRAHAGLDRGFGAGGKGTPDSILVYFNNGHASTRFDVPAYLDPTVNRVRVPIRFVSEMMGAKVNWEGSTGRVTIQFETQERDVMAAIPLEGKPYSSMFNAEEFNPDSFRYLLEERRVSIPSKTIVLTIGHPFAVIDGKEVSLDAPPVIKDGRTMVPVRFIAEQMGSKVYWVGSTPIFRRADGTYSGVFQVHIFTPFHPLFEYPSWYLENRAQRF